MSGGCELAAIISPLRERNEEIKEMLKLLLEKSLKEGQR